MNFALTTETIEEGRAALHLLERQLKGRGGNEHDNFSDNISSKQHSSSDRKIMDQIPRNTRLTQRSESLGLTVEELDDRGLLEGGGSIPSYYTSVRQKNRRSLELQPRASRLQERGKEALSKMLNNFFHMIRVLTKKGLQLEVFYRQRDCNRTGCLTKRQFIQSIKNLCLPFTNKELQEIAVHYTHAIHGELIDYETFLREARILKKHPDSNNNAQIEAERISSSSLGVFSSVLQLTKRMLQESARSLNKSVDDVYRMFARWDTLGAGTVTATQFLRVLARLHVELSDQDQDFLVELLDTNSMGRIDFDSLISYCFGQNESDSAIPGSAVQQLTSPHGMVIGLTGNFDDLAGEILSAVSTEGNFSVELKSTHSNPPRRPHTASIIRPYHNHGESLDSKNPHNLPGDIQKNCITSHLPSGNEEFSPKGTRPMTASARVLLHDFQQKIDPKHLSRRASEDIQLVELPDDVIRGEEEYLKKENHSMLHLHASRNSISHVEDKHFRDLTTGHVIPSSTLALSMNVPDQQGGNAHNGLEQDPVDHLVLLASQILSTLRDLILARYRKGRSLQEIFQHFDREIKAYFDSHDFIRSTADLRIETSSKVAALAIQQMAIDGVDKVTFGEFKTFVLDTDYKLLELNVTEQVATLFEQQGRDFLCFIQQIFHKDFEVLRNLYSEEGEWLKLLNHGLVSKSSFISSLRKIGLKLTSAEAARLADRFDIHGNDFCSVERFLQMIVRSIPWNQAELVLKYQDRALEEASLMRKQIQNSSAQLLNEVPQLSEELITMCEYLGICVLSEQNMIWIAADALKAPLPVNWIAQKDVEGRTFFFNRLTGQSRWEHPLDPHFRKLRDRYRQSGSENDRNTPSPNLQKTRPLAWPMELEDVPSANSQPLPFTIVRPNIKAFTPKSLLAYTSSMKFPSTEFTSRVNDSSQYNRPFSAMDDGDNMTKPKRPINDKVRPISAPFKTISFQEELKSSSREAAINKSYTSAVLDATNALKARFISSELFNKSLPAVSNKDTQQQAPAPFAAYNNTGTQARNKSKSSGTKRLSAVERALSIGRTSSNLLKSDRDRGATNVNKSSIGVRLTEMIEGNIIEKLDVVMGKKI